MDFIQWWTIQQQPLIVWKIKQHIAPLQINISSWVTMILQQVGHKENLTLIINIRSVTFN